jgi:peptide/nickel transport system substrate-binding protein
MAEQTRVCAEIQRQVWIDVPYIPLGPFYGPTAHNRHITGVRGGFPQFYDVRPA